MDLVVGAITGYDAPQIAPWLRSLARCGFEGRTVMLASGITQDAHRLLETHRVLTVMYEPLGHAHVVERFCHVWKLFHYVLDVTDYEMLIFTDVKDVVFQSNPSCWVRRHAGARIHVACENLLYKDEPFGRGNMIAAYGDLDRRLVRDMLARPIYNAGTIAGEAAILKDLCLQVFALCRLASPRVPNPDQAALNILLHQQPYREMTRFHAHNAGWACQCGTTVDPTLVAAVRPAWIEADAPELRDDGLVYSSGRTDAEPFCLVHQYDRIPAWKQRLEEKYGAADGGDRLL